MLMEDVRVAYQSQIAAGSGTAPNLDKPATRRLRQGREPALPSLFLQAATPTAAAFPLLRTPSSTFARTVVLPTTSTAMPATLACCTRLSPTGAARSCRRRNCPTALRWGQASSFRPTQMPDNTLVVASVGNPRYHVLPIMGSVMVETDRSFAFDRDETNVRATIYCQSVVQNKMAFAVFTGTNNFTE